MRELVVALTRGPGPDSDFVEVEDANTGESVAMDWFDFGDGLHRLGTFADWREAQQEVRQAVRDFIRRVRVESRMTIYNSQQSAEERLAAAFNEEAREYEEARDADG